MFCTAPGLGRRRLALAGSVSALCGRIVRSSWPLPTGEPSLELDALESHIGRELPVEAKAILAVHNGQKSTDTASRIEYATPCLHTLSFLSTTLIQELWDFWNDLLDAPDADELQDMGDVFPAAAGKVKPLYFSPGWIPLWSDPVRNDGIGLDLDPDRNGTYGQIINFGRDEKRHFLCAPDYTTLLHILLEEVLTGAWPATEIASQSPDGTWTDLPWFGDPDDHFFNALYSRFEARQHSNAHSNKTDESGGSGPAENPTRFR
ncbi:SMI1/KNR4 family protein [Nocardia sp. CA-151230]|uniref:SMI1/KNR4 family protein n=1 Tax=Nocardia sp. CA-151230 TaxID=3239982 RepID=UPI003D946C0F